MFDLMRISRRQLLRTSAGLAAGLAASVWRPAVARAQAASLPVRRVWLRLLADHAAEQIRAGKPLGEQAKYFAGLTRVQYIYLDEQQGDVVLEGPAEDRWKSRPDGIALGEASGQPVLQLDDFVVAWRNANDGSPPPSVSLEHRPESTRRIQQAFRTLKAPRTAEARREFSKRLEEAWGPQNVVTGGVPVHTRFNHVMADADWEMKRISLGHSETGIDGFPTYVDLEFADLEQRVTTEGAGARKPPGGSRFWFFPAYEEFARTEKLDAVAIPDDPVQLLTESHFRNLAQGRVVTEQPSEAAKKFVQAFTDNYGKIAQANPTYAELRNLFDWVAVAKLLRLIDAPRRIGWDFAFLLREYAIAEVHTPANMPGLVAVRHAEIETAEGRANVVFPAWGGVSIDVSRVVAPERLAVDRSLEARLRAAVARRPPRREQWWSAGD